MPGEAEPDFDVIVVGAGIAGCVTAYQLAQQGRSVVLIERGEAPGSKNLSGEEGGPSLHVVVGDAFSEGFHAAPSLILGGGDRTHDGLLDALDVVRVADEGLVRLVPGAAGLRGHQGAAEVVPAGDVLLGDKVHAVT